MKKFNKKEYQRIYMQTYSPGYYQRNKERIQAQRKKRQQEKTIIAYLEGKIDI